jgi:hypothetical protein
MCKISSYSLEQRNTEKEYFKNFTLWQSPQRMEYLQSSFWATLPISFQPNHFLTNVSTHLQMSGISPSGEIPSITFRAAAIFTGRSDVAFEATITACNTYLNARITISWTHRDSIWGSFSASSICKIQRPDRFSNTAKQFKKWIETDANSTSLRGSRILTR